MNIASIFDIQTPEDFNQKAIAVFQHQFEHNAVYRSFCDLLCVHPSEVHQIKDIPFLPIQFFKSHEVVAASTKRTEKIFTSSGTTGTITSKHHVKDLGIYEQSFRQAFTHFYGNIEEYVVLALLPSYLEREGSSLIYMANDMIKHSKHPESGFYLNELDLLSTKLTALDEAGQKVLLLGVSFALLDLVERHTFDLKHTIVMETGGMKGRRKEIIREELHHTLQKGFGVSAIHSEYGMTELLSQAYSKGKGHFSCPPWMQVLTRETEDPLSLQTSGKTGGINIIDLANFHSCAFIATQDLGRVCADGTFEVLGRFDHSDIRGCNLMVV